MGANGSFASGSTDSKLGRNWKTVGTVGKIQVVQLKNPKMPNKLPEESHSPNRLYAIFEKDGRDVKAIAKYGPDGKKIWEIHTTDHKGMGAHVHYYKVTGPVKGGEKSLSECPALQTILDKVRNYNNG